MKNNLFLSTSSKNNNERFNFLDSSQKENNYSDKKNPKTSSFKNNKDNNNPNYTRESRFSYPKSSSKKSNSEFNLLDEDFPVLNLKKDNDNQTTDLETTYRDIAAVKEELNNTSINNNIKPGCVEIYKNGIFKYGPLTSYQIQMNKINYKKELLSQDSNYCMNEAINYMRNNWQGYRDDYDSVYGDGAYEDKFIYKSEFESDDENDYDSSTDIDSEIDFIEYNESIRDDFSYRDY